MVYSLSSIMNTQLNLGKGNTHPLKKYRELNNLDFMTIEEFLFKYNKDLDKFTLKQLVAKLEKNCTIYGPGKLSKGEAQVNSSFIYEVIARHYTEAKGHDEKIKLDSDIRANDNNRKYLIYFVVDNRGIASYYDMKKKRVKYRRKKLQERYTYSNPLNRIHGFCMLDDDPCLCREKEQTYLSIKVICANPFASKANIKAVGSYILMFIMCMAYKYHFDKLILEVTNSQAADILGEEEEDDSDDEEEDSDDEEEDSDDEEEDSDDEEDDDEEEEDSDDEEDDDEEEDEEDDSDDEEDDERKCCDVAISNNIKCNDDEEDDEDYDSDTKDKYDYVERIDELDQLHGKKDLIELCECYEIDFSKKDSKTELIYKIIRFEFWTPEEFEDSYENDDCESEWMTEDDPDLGYGGKIYLKGKNETKNLYCKFYEKHGFRENSKLNTVEKCFSIDPLPSMEIKIGENRLEDLLKVFFERNYYKQTSKFCGLVKPNKLIIKD